MERSRQTPFAEKLSTQIWREVPAENNPYLAERQLCHGYELTALMHEHDATDMLYLMLKRELPGPERKDLLRRFSVAFCSPGPRHPASRAVMNAAASGTEVQHLLPIGLGLLGGTHQGAVNIGRATRFIGRGLNKEPDILARDSVAAFTGTDSDDAEITLVPGFGRLYGDIDPWAQRLASSLADSPGAGRGLAWARAFAEALAPSNYGWLTSGVAAAACVDLGLPARAAIALFQLVAGPGLMAHGLEMAGKTIHDLPFLDESNCEFLEGSES